MRRNPRRPVKQSWHVTLAVFLITAVPVLALTVCSLLYLRKLGLYLDPRLAPLVAQAAADTYHREVRLSHISVFERPGTVVLRGLAVSNGKTFKDDHGLSFAQVPAAVVSYDLPGLLRDPANALTMIRSVELSRPDLYAEQLTPGKFNFSPLIKPPNPARPFPFQGRIVVHQGTLTVRDDNAPKLLGVQQNHFTAVNATVDLTTPGHIGFVGTAAGATNRFASVQLHGDVLDPPRSAPVTSIRGYSLRVHIVHGNVPYLTDYFASFLRKTLKIQEATGDGDLTVGEYGTTKPGALTVLGNVIVHDGSVSLSDHGFLRRPLENVNARLVFTTTDLALDGTTVVSGVPVTVHGALLGFARPRLALSIDSRALTYSGLKDALTIIPALPPGVSISAPASAATWVTGDLRNPRVEASAKLASLVYSGTELTAIEASGSYYDGVLRVGRILATAPATKGSLDLKGYVLTRKKPLQYGVSGQIANLNVGGLPLPPAFLRRFGPVAGIASAQVIASSGGIQASVAVARASIKQAAFNDISGRIVWTFGNTIHLHRLVAHLANGGVVYADGAVPTGRAGGSWNLSVQAAQIGLGRLIGPFVHVPIGGELYLFGNLHGIGAIPQISGHLTVLVPHYGNFVADELKGTFTAGMDGVQLERVVIQRFPGNAVISGGITQLASGNPALNLHATVDGAQLSDLTRLAAQQSPPPTAARIIAASSPTLTGNLAATFDVTGTLTAPKVAGQLALSNATYSVLELNHALADVTVSKNMVRISRLSGEGSGFQLSGSGTYGFTNHRVTGQLNAMVDDVGRLLPPSYSTVPVSGPLSIEVAASGTSESPFATVHVTGDGDTVAGVPLDMISLDAQYERNAIHSVQNGLQVAAGNARYRIPQFRYDLRTTQFSLTGQVIDETVSHLIAAARTLRLTPDGKEFSAQPLLARLPQNSDGQISIPLVHAEGALKNPTAQVILDAKNLVSGPERLDSLHADVRYADAAFDIASFEARGKPDAYLSFGGRIDPRGMIDARLEASGIDLAPLNAFLSLKKSIGGEISDLTVVATGQTRTPALNASVTLNRPSYGDDFVDSLDSGQISVDNNQILVNGLQVVKDETTASGQVIEHIASVRGSLPFAWEAGAVLTPIFPRDVPLSFTLSIPPQSLSSIPALFPGIPLKFPEGTISADIGLGGTLANKQITGSLVVANGSIQTDQLKTSLRKVNLNLSLVGNQARLSFAADSTAGGSVRITGGATLTNGPATDASRFASELISGIRLDLNATATNFLVNEPKITQFGNAGFRGTVNGTVRVTEALRSPVVSGKITLSDVIGVLPSLSQTAGAAPPIPLVNPQFQLGVAVAKGSHLRNSLLDAQIDGGLTVAGTLAQPNVTGDFLIRQGIFRFPTATFRVIPVGTVHLAYLPPNDPVERVDLTAQTQINVSDATIAANPAGAGSEAGSYIGPKSTPASQTTRNYTITVTIQGLLNNPDRLRLDFQSDPAGLTQSQILATIGGQQALAGVSQAFTTLAVPLALQPVERGIASGLGLEDFSIAYSPEAPVSLTFVKRLGPKIGLTYTQMVNSRSTGAVANTIEPPIFQLKLDYSFTDRFRFSISTDDQRNTIVGLERVYSF